MVEYDFRSSCAAGVWPLWHPKQYFSTNGRTVCWNCRSSARVPPGTGRAAMANTTGRARNRIGLIIMILNAAVDAHARRDDTECHAILCPLEYYKLIATGRWLLVLAAVSFVRPAAAQRPAPVAIQHPDLAGIWNSATATPLERPARFKNKEFFTPQEAAEWERLMAAENEEPSPKAAAKSVGTYNTA